MPPPWLTLALALVSATALVYAAWLQTRTAKAAAVIKGESEFRADLLKRVDALQSHCDKQDELIDKLRVQVAVQQDQIASLRSENRGLRRQLAREAR